MQQEDSASTTLLVKADVQQAQEVGLTQASARAAALSLLHQLAQMSQQAAGSDISTSEAAGATAAGEQHALPFALPC